MKKHILFPLIIIALIVSAIGFWHFTKKPSVPEGAITFEEILTEPTGETITVDNSVYDDLLQKYVDKKGQVNYRDWKKDDEDTLIEYIEMLEEIDPRLLTRNEKLAYFINAYNALTIQGILEFYPLESIKDKVSVVGYNIWDDYLMTVQEREISLNDIENNILRKMDEPRIHFAIVCASIGCPELYNRAWEAANIEETLEERTFEFFKLLRNFKPIQAEKKIVLSSILKWFAEDFGENEAELVEYVKQYTLFDVETKLLEHPDLKVEYADYNWGLNEQEYEDEEEENAEV